MARIRSTHPSQWTDENFVQCSAFARLLALAIRNEADDHGVFEWKPLTIKMRAFPADNINIVELLTELKNNNIICSYEIDGKKYGAIRNFMKFQKPKKPSYIYPISEKITSYVSGSPEQVPNQFRTSSEINLQMEEEEDKEEDIKDTSNEVSKKPQKRKPKISIQQWEEKHGVLSESNFESFRAKHGLQSQQISVMLEKFRNKCLAQDYRYADFARAFESWNWKDDIPKNRVKQEVRSNVVTIIPGQVFNDPRF